jgi:hypothetical protein
MNCFRELLTFSISKDIKSLCPSTKLGWFVHQSRYVMIHIMHNVQTESDFVSQISNYVVISTSYLLYYLRVF